jgi:hypothetical protein
MTTQEADTMCFLISLIPATFWITVGYFVIFSSAKVDGAISTFARILAIWIFILALLFPVCGAYFSLSGKCPLPRAFDKVERVINR